MTSLKNFLPSPRRQLKGFTMLELILVIGIMAALSLIVIASINPRKQLLAAKDSERRAVANAIQKSFFQYLIDSSTDKVNTYRSKYPGESGGYLLPRSQATAIPICKDGYVPSSWSSPECIRTSQLVANGKYIASITRDSMEPCPQFSGYSVWSDKDRATVIPNQLGVAAPSKPFCYGTCPTPYAQSSCANTLPSLCGNSVLNPGENCDDANMNNGDGCSSACQIESGWSCLPFTLPSQCFRNISLCGNGIMDVGEQCDDQNTSDGDGCSSSCTVEPGWFCYNPGDLDLNNPSICTSCTDGSCQAGENANNACTGINEDCDNNCNDNTCSNYETAHGQCTAQNEDCNNCTNGVCSPYEQNNGLCTDVGNAEDCVNNCTDGFCSPLEMQLNTCQSTDQDCAPFGTGCNSGVCSFMESTNGDCTAPGQDCSCGNGQVNAYEQCDDGNADNLDSCTNACQNAFCGDGICAYAENPGTCPQDCP